MQMIIFITGVSGSGKTTIGKLLASAWGLPYYDADDFHPRSNIEKMESGIPLTDDDRWDWLHALNQKAKVSKAAVISCSALKESYREALVKDLPKDSFQFVHLHGDKEVILARMKRRTEHFMPSSLLDSQFDIYEKPQNGIILNIVETPDNLISKIKSALKDKSEIGVVGLGVMGTSIARNIGSKGYKLSIYNRHVDEIEVDVAKNKKSSFSELEKSQAFDDVGAFVNSLARPRKILLMVNAGEAVDQMIEALGSHLDADDIIVDGGNSNYKDTQQRYDKLKAQHIHFIGCGISGGEEGALKGPSMMPGASRSAYKEVAPIFETIAAKSPTGSPCCNYIGNGGAGHFVKMVHNGIEYGEMQLIAECYAYLRHAAGLNPNTIATIFTDWAADGLDSYLLEITIEILKAHDQDGILVLDKILDKAGNKGTGAWTTIAAAELGVAIPTITAALYARYQSFFKETRTKAAQLFVWDNNKANENYNGLKALYQVSRILNHRQGIELIKAASNAYGWEIDLQNLITVWTAGCIIRSSLLMDIKQGLENEDFLLSKHFVQFFNENMDAVEAAYTDCSSSSAPCPAIAASINYFKTLIQENGSANLIQAQRDYFGAHTFKWKSDPDGISHHHNWTNS